MTDPYDTFYYSTACHVCKCIDTFADRRLKRCGGCKMVSYCSTQHQKIHWPIHRNICKCINSILKAQQKLHLFQVNMETTIPEQWCKLRTSLMLMVQLKMVKKLSTTEQQLFWFPRVCELCKEAKQETLIDCEKCHCVSYCSKIHQQEDVIRHERACHHLDLSLSLDRYLMDVTDHYSGINVPVQYTSTHLPLNMDVFINTYVKSDIVNRQYNVAITSEFLSCPLTLIYALEELKMQSKRKLNVHVVGAGLLECTYLRKWEVILHCLPECSNLNIEFVGPDVEENFEPICELCEDCQTNRKTLNINFLYGKLYHEYANLDVFSRPDVIVAYNCGFHEFLNSDRDSWLPTIPYLVKHKNVPLVITSYTETEAEVDVRRILDFDIEIILYCKKNPFSSKRPYRDWTDEDKVFFINMFLSIVRPY